MNLFLPFLLFPLFLPLRFSSLLGGCSWVAVLVVMVVEVVVNGSRVGVFLEKEAWWGYAACERDER